MVRQYYADVCEEHARQVVIYCAVVPGRFYHGAGVGGKSKEGRGLKDDWKKTEGTAKDD